uniref:Uncharacterized protein n=1 Tax=Anguilla anguilla TaxID=7936 RepID=A0A0E9XUJ2_ANGAN
MLKVSSCYQSGSVSSATVALRHVIGGFRPGSL